MRVRVVETVHYTRPCTWEFDLPDDELEQLRSQARDNAHLAELILELRLERVYAGGWDLAAEDMDLDQDVEYHHHSVGVPARAQARFWSSTGRAAAPNAAPAASYRGRAGRL
jgi:hypothetical protein